MNIFKNLTRRASAEREQHALDLAAEAEAGRQQAMEALDVLTRAVGTCKLTTIVPPGTVSRNIRDDGSLWVRAPHDQDPRVQSALTVARELLGRAL